MGGNGGVEFSILRWSTVHSGKNSDHYPEEEEEEMVSAEIYTKHTKS